MAGSLTAGGGRLLRAVLPALVLTACAPDERAPLETCTYARYWADCGGNAPDADPVLGCDRATGECRWFFGGEIARGYEVSDCPVDDVCCHGQSPFTGWLPDGTALDVTRTDVGLFSQEGVLGSTGPYDVTVVTDHVGAPERARLLCGATPPSIISCPAWLSPDVRQVGEAILVSLVGTAPMLQLEIYPTGGTPHARIYAVLSGPGFEAPPDGWLCGIAGWSGYLVPIDAGTLHVTPEGLTDPTLLHGHLEASIGAASFSIDF